MKKQKKQIRFPLEMKDGKKVNSLDELRENFSISKLQEYFLDGRLTVWLRHRSLDVLAEGITNIPKEADDSLEQICRILEISISDEVMEEIERYKDKAEETEDVDEENETLEAEEVIGDTGPVEEKENVFFRANDGIWLDTGESMTEVLHREERYNFSLGRGFAAEGDELYIICDLRLRSKRAEQYAIKRYNIRSGSWEIIVTLTEDEKESGEKKNLYYILGIRNHILVYWERKRYHKEINLHTLNILTRESKNLTIPSSVAVGWEPFQMLSLDPFDRIYSKNPPFLIDAMGTHIYSWEIVYNKNCLAKIDLESGKIERLCTDWFGLARICDEGAVFRRYVHENCYFYNFKKRELKRIPWSLNRNVYYHKGKVYCIANYNKSQLYVSEYNPSTEESKEIKKFTVDRNMDSIPDIRVSNDKVYVYLRESYNSPLPDYRIDMNEWFIEKLVRSDNRLLWETYDDKKPSDIGGMLGRLFAEIRL